MDPLSNITSCAEDCPHLPHLNEQERFQHINELFWEIATKTTNPEDPKRLARGLVKQAGPSLASEKVVRWIFVFLANSLAYQQAQTEVPPTPHQEQQAALVVEEVLAEDLKAIVNLPNEEERRACIKELFSGGATENPEAPRELVSRLIAQLSSDCSPKNILYIFEGWRENVDLQEGRKALAERIDFGPERYQKLCQLMAEILLKHFFQKHTGNIQEVATSLQTLVSSIEPLNLQDLTLISEALLRTFFDQLKGAQFDLATGIENSKEIKALLLSKMCCENDFDQFQEDLALVYTPTENDDKVLEGCKRFCTRRITHNGRDYQKDPEAMERAAWICQTVVDIYQEKNQPDKEEECLRAAIATVQEVIQTQARSDISGFICNVKPDLAVGILQLYDDLRPGEEPVWLFMLKFALKRMEEELHREVTINKNAQKVFASFAQKSEQLVVEIGNSFVRSLLAPNFEFVDLNKECDKLKQIRDFIKELPLKDQRQIFERLIRFFEALEDEAIADSPLYYHFQKQAASMQWELDLIADISPSS